MRDSKGRFINGGVNYFKGKKLSEEHRRHLSEAKKGKPAWNKGIPMTEEAKEKCRQANFGKRMSPSTEFKKGFTPWNKGTKGVMKAWNKGVPMSEETRRKVIKNNAQRGKRSSNWKGGITRNQGYIYIYQPFHKRANKKGYVKKADVIMEEFLQRNLEDNEIVHHINHIKDDDIPENLMVITRANHAKLHLTKKRLKKMIKNSTRAIKLKWKKIKETRDQSS